METGPATIANPGEEKKLAYHFWQSSSFPFPL